MPNPAHQRPRHRRDEHILAENATCCGERVNLGLVVGPYGDPERGQLLMSEVPLYLRALESLTPERPPTPRRISLGGLQRFRPPIIMGVA